METETTITIHAALAALCAAERGFVLGTLLIRDGDAATDDAGGLAEPAASRCRAVLSAIAVLSRPERLRWIGLLAREAVAPLPAGIDEVPEEVLEMALHHQSPFVIRLLAAHGPAALRRAAATVLSQRLASASEDAQDGDTLASVGPDLVAELQRAVFARIVAVPPATAAPTKGVAPGLAPGSAALPINDDVRQKPP